MSQLASIIPVENIFYMLCYAWNVLPILDDIPATTDDYDNACNLLARVFSFALGKLIRSGMHRSYIEFEENLSNVHGKLNVHRSVNEGSLLRKKLFCSFDEYSFDNNFNKIINYTIESLITNRDVDEKTRNLLRGQRMFFSGLGAIPPTKNNRKLLVFTQNNVTYKLLICLATLLYENTAVSSEKGKNTFKDFFREEQMHKVFEKFILNFYATHLARDNYNVHAPNVNWPIDTQWSDLLNEIFDVDTDIVNRRTDIVIENTQQKLQIIIDAKYYHNTLVKAYRNEDDERVRASHLNQIRGYLLDSNYIGDKYGALIYPMVDNDISKGIIYPIHGSPIILKTINLNSDWRAIESDLLGFIHKIEVAQDRISPKMSQIAKA